MFQDNHLAKGIRNFVEPHEANQCTQAVTLERNIYVSIIGSTNEYLFSCTYVKETDRQYYICPTRITLVRRRIINVK